MKDKGAMMLRIMTLSIMTLSITKLKIKVTLSINDTQLNNPQPLC